MIKWTAHNNTYFPVRPGAEQLRTLPPNVYDLTLDFEKGPVANVIPIKEEGLIHFDSGPAPKIMEEVRKFWTMKGKYDTLGIPYRRGILMHGEPGTGKSGIIRILCKDVVNDGGIVTIVKNITTLETWLPILNELEPGRNLMVVIEDIDEMVEHTEYELLQMLDGVGNHRDGMLFVATTNYLDELPDRVYRPSRFDYLVEVSMPNARVRSQYIEDLCNRFNVPMRQDIVDRSEGMSFAHMKEFLVSCLLYNRDVDEVAARMHMHKHLNEEHQKSKEGVPF